MVYSEEPIQCGKTLMFINVPENQSDSQASNRRAFQSYLNHMLSILQISSPFSYTKRFQLLGLYRLKKNRPVVLKFTTTFLREYVLNGSRLLATSPLLHIGIVLNVLNPSKYCKKPPEASLGYLCRIAATALASAPSSTTDATHYPAITVHCFPSVS